MSVGLVAGLVLTASATAAPRNGKIAFLSNRDYRGRVYVMNPDGRLATPLTNGRFAGGLSWSPDGRRFVSSDLLSGVFTAASDGSGRRLVLPARGLWEESLAWSPDGSTIAFSARCGTFSPCAIPAPGQIQLMKADGSEAHGISGARPDSEDSIAPSWSPDGARIAFARYVPAYGVGTNLWVMNADGSGQRMLTAGGEPAWSPDGRWIAFVRKVRQNLDVPVYAIFLVHPDGSGLHRLTSSAHGSDGSPAWSPDSHRLLYSHRVYAGFSGWSEIHVIRADGTGDHNLTPNWSANVSPAWQPVTGAAPPSPPVIPAVVAPPMRPRVTVRSRAVRLRVECRRTRGVCAGTATLIVGDPNSTFNERGGTSRFSARAGHRTDVRLAFTAAIRQRLRRDKRLSGGPAGQEARAVVRCRDTTSVQKISLRIR